jgi:hypothetical protein
MSTQFCLQFAYQNNKKFRLVKKEDDEKFKIKV